MGILYRPGDGITYGVPDRYYEENVFRTMEREDKPLPTWEESRDLLPRPFWDGHDDAIACYDKAWEIAFSNLRQPTEISGFKSNFIDTAFNGFLFMWDSSFILMFGKYGTRVFNFQNTLNNMYARQHSDGFICREICETGDGEQFFRHDPASTGPNVMAWSEWVYFENFGDLDRISKIFAPLMGYYRWLKLFRTWRDGTYWSSGYGCGMDNSPRIETKYYDNLEVSNGHMVWIDACCQQILSGNILVKMAKLLGREEETKEIEEEVAMLASFVNEKMWDEKDGFYYDLWSGDRLSGSKTLASYWALLAGIVPEERIDRFVSHLFDPNEFYRVHVLASLSADHPEFQPKGDYWRGSVWAPTAYMTLKGLDAVGKFDLAHKLAMNHHENVVKVFNDTGTVWENYAPDFVERGSASSPDFVGWSGLPPIAVLLEYVMGIIPDGQNKTVTWHVNLTERHGVKKYPLGTEAELDLICEARKSEDERPVVTVNSNIPVTVKVVWSGEEYEIRT